MIVLTIFLALLLAAYLLACSQEWGVPEMISDTYYQGARGWFTAVMAAEAVGLAALIIGCPEGSEWLGLLGAVGLLMVGLLPAYKHCRRHLWAHKAAAYVAAVGCVGWCCSVDILPTMYCVIAMVGWMIMSTEKRWLVAECLAFADVFATVLVSL